MTADRCSRSVFMYTTAGQVIWGVLGIARRVWIVHQSVWRVMWVGLELTANGDSLPVGHVACGPHWLGRTMATSSCGIVNRAKGLKRQTYEIDFRSLPNVRASVPAVLRVYIDTLWRGVLWLAGSAEMLKYWSEIFTSPHVNPSGNLNTHLEFKPQSEIGFKHCFGVEQKESQESWRLFMKAFYIENQGLYSNCV